MKFVQPGFDTEVRWVKNGGKSVFGHKQHMLVDDNGLVMTVKTIAANQHDSKPMLSLLHKAAILVAEYSVTGVSIKHMPGTSYRQWHLT